MWTTCLECRGSGLVIRTRDEGHLWEDDCPVCHGDGGVYVGDEEYDEASLDDVDVKDED